MANYSSPTVLQADPNHRKLQLTVLLMLLLLTVVLWRGLNGVWTAVWPQQTDFKFVATCGGSVGLALVLMLGVEAWLRRVWPSGRRLQLDSTGISAYDAVMPAVRLSWQAAEQPLAWQFVLKGYKRSGAERLVPDGWFCLAVQLQEGNQRLIVYSYASGKQAEALWANGRVSFQPLVLAELYPKREGAGYFSLPRRPDKIPAALLAGADGRYWLAEQRRWHEGFELSFDDFKTFMQHLNEQQATAVA